MVTGFEEIVLRKCAKSFMFARAEKLYTQAQLAEKAHVTQSSLSRFESCRSNPTLKYLHRLAEALDMELQIELEPVSKYDDFFKELLAKESEFR